MTDLAGYKPTILTLHPYGMDVIFVWSLDEQHALELMPAEMPDPKQMVEKAATQ